MFCFLDGVVTKREMLGYLDPKHPYRASKEAQKIIDAADSNSDGVLEVEEFIKVCIGFYSVKKSVPKPISRNKNYVLLTLSIF